MKFILLSIMVSLVSVFARAGVMGIWDGPNAEIEVSIINGSTVLKVTSLYTNFCGPLINTEGMKLNENVKLDDGVIPVILLTLSEDEECIKNHMKNGEIQYGDIEIRKFNIDDIFNSNSVLKPALLKYRAGQIDIVIEFQRFDGMKEVRFSYEDANAGKILYKSAFKDRKQIYPEWDK